MKHRELMIGESTIGMSHKEQLEFYYKLRAKIGQDSKSHASMLTKDGAFIDGKLYPFKKEVIQNRKSKK